MLDITQIRPHFPALARLQHGRPIVFFDGPAGTQVTQSCIDGIVEYFTRSNANTHGQFMTSHETDAIIVAAHEWMADMLNAQHRDEVYFGANMTSLTFALSRSLGQTLQAGDEIILTKLDHDANYSPWHLMAQDKGVTVHSVDINEVDCTLNLDDFEKHLSHKTKLVAIGCASNAVGTVNPLKQIIGMAKAVGALTFLDAVHYAPHAPIDVQDLGCDFLGCSTYKFFAPHMGVIYGRKALLESLPAYKVRPADNALPSKFETGTQNHEHMAGLNGTMAYLEWLGKTYPAEVSGHFRSTRAKTLHQALQSIQDYEADLSRHMLSGLSKIHGCQVYGITDPARIHQRTPTFGIRLDGENPHATAKRLGEAGICVWSGNYYALNLTERLGIEESGGMVRVGFAHYNTHAEIDRFLQTL